jgi:hypothetical protein
MSFERGRQGVHYVECKIEHMIINTVLVHNASSYAHQSFLSVILPNNTQAVITLDDLRSLSIQILMAMIPQITETSGKPLNPVDQDLASQYLSNLSESVLPIF